MNEFNKFSELEEVLDGGTLGDECLTFIETHGYLAATVISPIATSDVHLITEILGIEHDDPSVLSNQTISQILVLRDHIARELLAGESLAIPLSSENEEEYVAEMEAWSAAFMEKHLLSEDAWFEIGGEDIAELLLPIVAASNLVDDPDLGSIREEETLYLSMLENIPEVVIDLYAIFHESARV